jgi:peptide deformylase
MRILYYPEPVLAEPADEVEEIDGALVETCRAMLVAMYEARGIGLAGPQVGLRRRIVVANPTGEPDGDITVVNPLIVEQEGTAEAEEGCLSLPGLYHKIRRSARVLIRAYDLDGNEVEFEAEGLNARMWQHEVDHLNGVLIVDRLSRVGRMAVGRTLKDLERQFERAHR